MLTKSHWILLFCLAACAKDKAPAEPRQEPVQNGYEEVASRLMPMLDNGWVVSRFAGEPRDQGDSLIFTGIAMGALDCTRGAIPEAALVKMLREKNGGVYRHPSIPDDYSLDGLLGFWWGISRRTGRCPETRELWASLLPQHQGAISVEPFFGVALQTVMADLGVSGAPTVGERGQLGSEVAAWAIGVVSQRQAAYRLHLGFLTLDLVDAPKGKSAFCDAVPQAKIPLLEHFCGRSGLSSWVDGFAYNRSVYAFQRADWESESVPPGVETPAIDLLVALAVLYPESAIPSTF